jgi:RNA polymerase sigma-70 factor (ECF subfamily)
VVTIGCARWRLKVLSGRFARDDALDLSAAEVAEVLDTTSAAVNSGLQRARARLDDVAVGEDRIDEPADPSRRALVNRYVAAFENADIAALKRLLTDDAVMEMPPVLNRYVGREAYARFIARLFAMRGTDWRMRPTAANGQPAVAAYVRGEDGTYHVHTLQVFTVTGSGISRNVVFQDPSPFATFGLPSTLDAGAPAPELAPTKAQATGQTSRQRRGTLEDVQPGQ